jgi:hypothetical protein
MFTLEGTINGMRAVSGKVEKGKNAGSFWHFVSMEVCDPRFGQVYSCQIRQDAKKLFEKFVKVGPGKDPKTQENIEVASLTQDLSGHNVKLLIKGIGAGERTTGEGENQETIIQVRFYVAGLIDQGEPKTDEF